MSKTFCAAVLFGILIITCAAAGLSHAVVITPDLQQTMQSAGPSGDVSVIINLADRVDLNAITAVVPDQKAGNDKVRKRKAIVSALKARANLTQGFLKTLLQNRGAKKMKSLWITNSIAVTVPVSVIIELMSMPEIESIEADAVIRAPAVTPAAAATPEWNIIRINAPTLWNAGITGTGTVVANLDTGVDVTHPDLQPKWRGGACTVPPDCDSWFDPYTNSIQPYDKAGSSTGHGTGTMGVMAGESATDAYGVAPGSKWIAAKIFDDTGDGFESDIILAMQWLLAPGGNAVNAPDIVNNSWGFAFDPYNQCSPSLPNVLQNSIQNVQAAGIAMVFSAGNSGPNPSTSVSPANYPGNLAVGATDSSDVVYFLSSRGPSACDGGVFPNVAAPGVGIYTAAPVSSGSYQTKSGTSFSAPHVAGAMALLLNAFPTLTPAEINTAFEQTAVHLPPVGTTPNNDYGYGLIDVSGALSFITAHGYISIPQLNSYAASLNYGDVGQSSSSWQTFTITNNTGSSTAINSVAIAGTDALEFFIFGDTCTGITLAPSGYCSFTVAVVPVTTGAKSAEIGISYGDPAVVYTVPLTCTVVGPVARVQGTTIVATYSSIQTAYKDCVSGDIIKVQAITFPVNTNFNALADIPVSLQGGYDSPFGSQMGFTTLQGALTISRGTVNVGNIILQ